MINIETNNLNPNLEKPEPNKFIHYLSQLRSFLFFLLHNSTVLSPLCGY